MYIGGILALDVGVWLGTPAFAMAWLGVKATAVIWHRVPRGTGRGAVNRRCPRLLASGGVSLSAMVIRIRKVGTRHCGDGAWCLRGGALHQLVEFTAIEPHVPALRAVVDLYSLSIGDSQGSVRAGGHFIGSTTHRSCCLGRTWRYDPGSDGNRTASRTARSRSRLRICRIGWFPHPACRPRGRSCRSTW